MNSGEIWRQEAGMTVFAPFEANTDYFGRQEQAFMLNFRVSDIDAIARPAAGRRRAHRRGAHGRELRALRLGL